jgi:16S rRNA (cytosine967-C5)-methyltransferase
LIRVEGGAFSSRLLAGLADPTIRVLVLETLRWLRTVDAVLRPRCRRPLEELDPEVRAALRIGLVETMRLDTPPALATDGAVRLCRRLGKSSASGMVNAVLRKAAAGWPDDLEGAPADLRFSHPQWLADRWEHHFGEAAATAAMAAAQQPSATWIWWLDERPPREGEGPQLRLEPHPWCPGCWRSATGAAAAVAAARDGRAYAQDPSSQLVAHLAHALAPGASRAIDLCAAPGGKSALLARLGGPRPAVAADRSLMRTLLMRPTLDRVGLSAVAVADAATPPFARASWDLVLLDAPCSGTGTFRRHPELKWRLQPSSIADLAGVQRGLLDAASSLVAPGGSLIYATCSVEPEENEELVAKLPSGFAVEDLDSVIPPHTPWIATPAGGVRILPHDDGDGFTIHAWRRST